MDVQGNGGQLRDSFIGELAEETNHLPQPMKNTLIRLGAWVTFETQRVMDGLSTPDALIEINQQIVEGLA